MSTNNQTRTHARAYAHASTRIDLLLSHRNY